MKAILLLPVMASSNLLVSPRFGSLALPQRLGERCLRFGCLLGGVSLLQAQMLLLRSLDLFVVMPELLLMALPSDLVACKRASVEETGERIVWRTY